MPRAKLSNAERAKALRAEIRDNATHLVESLRAYQHSTKDVTDESGRGPEETRALSFLARTLSPAQLKALDILCYPRTDGGLPGMTGQTHTAAL